MKRTGRTQTKTRIDITSDHLAVDTRAKEINAEFGMALLDSARLQWNEMSRKVAISDDTKERRKQALADGKSGWYKRRYGGGKRHTPPLAEEPTRYGIDSGKLRDGLSIRFRHSASRDRSVGSVNVSARRFDRSSWGPTGYEEWTGNVKQHVSILAGDLDKATLDPKVRARLQGMMKQVSQAMITKSEAQLQRLLAKRRRALLRLFREILKAAA